MVVLLLVAALEVAGQVAVYGTQALGTVGADDELVEKSEVGRVVGVLLQAGLLAELDHYVLHALVGEHAPGNQHIVYADEVVLEQLHPQPLLLHHQVGLLDQSQVGLVLLQLDYMLDVVEAGDGLLLGPGHLQIPDALQESAHQDLQHRVQQLLVLHQDAVVVLHHQRLEYRVAHLDVLHQVEIHHVHDGEHL